MCFYHYYIKSVHCALGVVIVVVVVCTYRYRDYYIKLHSRYDEMCCTFKPQRLGMSARAAAVLVNNPAIWNGVLIPMSSGFNWAADTCTHAAHRKRNCLCLPNSVILCKMQHFFRSLYDWMELHNGSGGSDWSARYMSIAFVVLLFERMQLKQQQMEAKYYSLRICNYERNGDSR